MNLGRAGNMVARASSEHTARSDSLDAGSVPSGFVRPERFQWTISSVLRALMGTQRSVRWGAVATNCLRSRFETARSLNELRYGYGDARSRLVQGSCRHKWFGCKAPQDRFAR